MILDSSLLITQFGALVRSLGILLAYHIDNLSEQWLDEILANFALFFIATFNSL